MRDLINGSTGGVIELLPNHAEAVNARLHFGPRPEAGLHHLPHTAAGRHGNGDRCSYELGKRCADAARATATATA
ncbi:hypothetical protein, partial [Xanthomonas euvesicatoria]|uniref:hypothetical protein n=1 Tax=Xanthomonas euvesicatoria TaxID=456327 RepID=UPI0038923CDA